MLPSRNPRTTVVARGVSPPGEGRGLRDGSYDYMMAREPPGSTPREPSRVTAAFFFAAS